MVPLDWCAIKPASVLLVAWLNCIKCVVTSLSLLNSLVGIVAGPVASCSDLNTIPPPWVKELLVPNIVIWSLATFKVVLLSGVNVKKLEPAVEPMSIWWPDAASSGAPKHLK